MIERFKAWPALCGLIGVLIGLALAPMMARAQEPIPQTYGGRELIVYTPSNLPAPGTRALVVVLHGGLGNAARVANRRSESGLNLDAVAEKDGFVVAYLNGTPATRLGGNMLAWNAGGGCCGQPFAKNTDDVAYISGAVRHLIDTYGIDPHRVYGTGHSNGAMMTQRLMCETDLYAAAVAVSGPLNLPGATCPLAKGKRILALHGAQDENVPIAGGGGGKGVSRVAYASEAQSQRVFTAAGAVYTLQVVANADHKLDNLDAAIQRSEGVTLAEKTARYFGLDAPKP